MRKKRWYVAHVLPITLIYYFFIFAKKIEGSRRGSRRGSRFCLHPCALFFTDGKDNFAGRTQEMNTWICNASGVAIFDFPDEGTVDDYLKRNGLYPSSTYIFLRTQLRHLLGDEFESSEPTGAESLPTSEERSSVAFSTVLGPTLTASDREVCKVCGCSFNNGETCLRCEQNHEYQQSLLAVCAKAAETEA